MSNSVHLNDEVLERYAMSRLSEAESESVEDHIATCAHCLDKLDEITAFVNGMRTALKDSGGEKEATEALRKRAPKWFQRWQATPVWAGIALAAAGALVMVNRPGDLSSPALVTLDGTRGTSTVVHGTGPFDFELFMPAEGKSYHVELLDGSGDKRWESDVPGTNGKLHAVIKQRVSAGQYYLHVTEPVSGSQHDYALRIEK
jgi:hypothetical protein